MSEPELTLDNVDVWKKGLRDALAHVEQCGLYRCPECKHLMGGPPKDFNICASCGVEFGYGADERPDIEPLWRAASQEGK